LLNKTYNVLSMKLNNIVGAIHESPVYRDNTMATGDS